MSIRYLSLSLTHTLSFSLFLSQTLSLSLSLPPTHLTGAGTSPHVSGHLSPSFALSCAMYTLSHLCLARALLSLFFFFSFSAITVLTPGKLTSARRNLGAAVAGNLAIFGGGCSQGAASPATPAQYDCGVASSVWVLSQALPLFFFFFFCF